MSPWALLNAAGRPGSSERYLLCELLEIYCWHQWDQEPREIRAIALSTAEGRAEERDELRATISFLSNVILDGRIKAFARRIGGGPCDPLPLTHWEIDDFEPRFAVSALNLERWWDPAAPPSHWIFLDGEDVDRFIDRWIGKVPGTHDEDSETPSIAIARPSDLRIIRLPEVQAMTGLSRSTIYAKMAAGDFPQRVLLGRRMAGWYEDAVKAWVADPR